jgi:hypothetical protein
VEARRGKGILGLGRSILGSCHPIVFHCCKIILVFRIKFEKFQASSSFPIQFSDTMGPMKAIAEVEEKVINIEDRIEKEVKKEAALLKEGDVDLNETPVRYLAFLGRIRPIVQPLTYVVAHSCSSDAVY